MASVISEEIRLVMLAAGVVVAVAVLLHERHYQSRRERILEGRVRVLEEIIAESRGV
jgi:hypothetical protein